MSFWMVAGLLVLGALTATVAPLLYRHGAGLIRQRSAMRIYQDQLDEIDRDVTRGLLSADEAEGARTEIKRRMVSMSRRSKEESTTVEEPNGAPFALRLLVMVIAVLGPAIGLFGYSMLGSPNIPSQPLAQRSAEIDEQTALERAAASLNGRLAASGGSEQEWVALGQMYMELGRPNDAVPAYRQATSEGDAGAGAYSRLAEAILFSTGFVTAEADTALDEALRRDPNNVAAVFYKSVALEQSGDLQGARDLLTPLLDSATPDAPWLGDVQRRVSELRSRMATESGAATPSGSATSSAAPPPGPTAADIAAASEMSDDDRAAMIKSMVDRLARKLEDDPQDVAGWLRLARSYSVLDDADAARNALERARQAAAALPENDPLHAEIAAAEESLL